jgi:hypothetical protein
MLIQRDFYLQKLIDRRENGRIKVISSQACADAASLYCFSRPV